MPVSSAPSLRGPVLDPRRGCGAAGDAQYGARGWQIIVDGKRKPIGRGYLAGPVTTPPLPDGGGTPMITLGAFLHPLRPEPHTVTVNGGFFGDALRDTYAFGFFVYEFTYTIIVEKLPHR
jgi:hypothetical protein